MALCTLCGKQEVMPFTCKFCGHKFCADHRLPENHDCMGLQKFKEERSREPEKWIYEPFQVKYKEAPVGRKVPRPLRERIRELLRNLNTRAVLYGIIAVILLILVLSGLKIL